MSLSTPPGLRPEIWGRVRAALAAKMVAELAFERALTPTSLGADRYRVAVTPAIGYEFRGRPVAMESWRIQPGSVTRHTDGTPEPADPYRLLLDLHQAWGLDPAVTALTVTELGATLAADAWLLATGPPVAELANLSHVELEGYQTGHPWIFANKGRVGFAASDCPYLPESRAAQRMQWMAVHRDLASFHGGDGLGETDLRERELDEPVRQRFTDLLTDQGADPAEYVWLPVHEWQWDEVVVPLFAAELAQHRILPLVPPPDRYRAQQSIRTFSNVSRPDRFDVKLPLSILNTMVYRGIPTELIQAAPQTTAWVHGIRDRDPFLRDVCRVVLPGEVAGVAVRHPVFEALPQAPYRYRQLLGVIWREPVAERLDPDERARTLAALLHVDPAGGAFVAELVRRSGLPPGEWLAALFAAVFPPLLHLLYRYGVAFNPHGENAIVIYDAADVPVRLAVKDFVDDLKLLDEDLPEYADLPARALGVLMRFGAEELSGSIFKSLLMCHFRYLGPLCEEQLAVPEEEFWRLARAEVLAYQARFPELAERFARFDLLAPDFPRVCLNRERLLPGGYHDRAERDASFHIDAPPVANPLHQPVSSGVGR
ncbi:siderophore synthetase component [Micromonospora pisi]|uniref:Siderophore synthetase component n=1 Tax=Micromonospora pisi TaxID=589240 RepID=A0A495JV59_9ACTN|nr:IucA/IucC family protein [Micromonospora pisi]RKR92438.1 siderophore synthetase component [Micromonospora pisi]